MLAAALLATAHPSALDQALQSATEAVLKEPVATFRYSRKIVAEKDEDSTYVGFTRTSDGKRVCFEVSSQAVHRTSIYKRPGEIFFANHDERKSFHSKDESIWSAVEARLRVLPEPGDWAFIFSLEGKLILHANPPFKVVSDKIEEVQAGKLRVIRFESRRKGTDTVTTGSAQFLPENGWFIRAEIDSNGSTPGKHDIRLNFVSQHSTIPEELRIDFSKYSDYERFPELPTDL